jgi:hypothetical protein
MNQYLELLRAEKSKTHHPGSPSKPSKPFEGFEGGCWWRVFNFQVCPAGVGHDRWLQAREDAGVFLETWAEQAAALGWTAEDLFRLHPTEPMARYDAMGLVWLLRGRPVVAMTESTATIKSPTGSLLTYDRFSDHHSSDRTAEDRNSRGHPNSNTAGG